jgi:hypothetical protein
MTWKSAIAPVGTAMGMLLAPYLGVPAALVNLAAALGPLAFGAGSGSNNGRLPLSRSGQLPERMAASVWTGLPGGLPGTLRRGYAPLDLQKMNLR